VLHKNAIFTFKNGKGVAEQSVNRNRSIAYAKTVYQCKKRPTLCKNRFQKQINGGGRTQIALFGTIIALFGTIILLCARKRVYLCGIKFEL
jgi:hypothetical protein